MTAINATIPTAVDDPRSTVRTFGDDLRSVPLSLRSERIKVTTLRANKVMLAATGVIGAAIAFALAATATDPSLTAGELFIYPLPLVAMLALVTGILMFTGEVQHGTLAVTLAARPVRWVTVAAKTIVAATVGVTYGALAMAAGFVGASAGGAPVGSASAIASRALWAVPYIGFAAVIGLGVGMIVRHGAGAISGLLMWSFVIESLFSPALPDGARHFLPFSAGYHLLEAGRNFKPPVVIVHQLGRPGYAAIFAGYALISVVVGTVLLYRRDSN
jgi:hypothetical protein